MFVNKIIYTNNNSYFKNFKKIILRTIKLNKNNEIISKID